MDIKNYYSKIDNFINYHYKGNFWQEKLLISCLLSVFVISAPFFNFKYFNTPNWEAIEYQISHFLEPIHTKGDSHVEKMAFRLFIPLLGKLLNLNRYGIYIGQVICGILFIYLYIKLTYRLLGDKIVTVLYVIASTNCYFILTAYYDVFGRPDVYPLLLLLIAIYSPNKFIIFVSCFLAAWCDERALINLGWVVLFWKIFNKDNTPITLVNVRMIAVALAGISYLLARLTLSTYFNMHTTGSDIGLKVILFNYKYISISIFTSYSAFWILTLFFFIFLFLKKEFLFFCCAFIFLITSVVISTLVFDIHRSMAYIFPLFIIAIGYLRPIISIVTLRKLLYLITLFNFMTPLIVWDGNFHYLPNIVVRLGQYIFLGF